MLWWSGCSSILGGYELSKAKSAQSPADADLHYARGCGYGHRECCEATLRALSGRHAPEAERIGALTALCGAAWPSPDLPSCTELGAILVRAGDLARAAPVLEIACTGGRDDACGWLGVSLEALDPVRARALLVVAVRDNPRFKPALARLSAEEHETTRLQLEACDANILEGCEALDPGANPEWEHTTTEACLFGDERSCARISALYARMEASPWSPERFYWTNRALCPADTDECRAAEGQWFAPIASSLRASCEGSDLDACTAYGRLLETGRGCEPNLGRAAALFRSACDGGVGEACFRYAHALQEGRGVLRDRITAVSWYDRSCTLGHAAGCELSGTVRYNGHGISRDLEAARELFEKACILGRCSQYAMVLEAGRGGPRDVNGARGALRKGCAAGEVESCFEIWSSTYHVPGELSRSLTPEGLRAITLAWVGCADWDPDACRVLGVMTSGGVGHRRLEQPGVKEMAAARACGLGWASGCQLGGDQEKACEMGIRWLCESLAEEGVRVSLPGIRP